MCVDAVVWCVFVHVHVCVGGGVGWSAVGGCVWVCVGVCGWRKRRGEGGGRVECVCGGCGAVMCGVVLCVLRDACALKTSWCVRSKRPLESQDDRAKQRRVLEDPDEDEVMIGEVQVNEEVEHPKSEVSATEFYDWQLKEYEGILRELQSQNDFMIIHGVPSSEVANKEVIKTRWGSETTK